ncbi:MAG: bifunctional phosphopantothenoylcysteine decarboxylase/phosphopantothenate--cysteine ligase CoaBC [Bdellovibrionota bacterium]|nr:bifunctional phosphopantothenoylcysteine decarboxylase/phosphopantothenate--cysteine ligase CoaBC [Bdellovibrionota bacterium]
MKFFEWDFSPPQSEALGDREVPLLGKHLNGMKIALIVTGGIAAMKAPFICRSLRKQGAKVTAFLSEEASRYVGKDALAWSTNRDIVTRLTYEAEHLSDQSPFDAFCVAPATYNFINKVSQGIADTPTTSIMASALGKLERGKTKVVFCPTMHGSMHNSLFIESCKKLKSMGCHFLKPRDDYGKHNIPDEEIITVFLSRLLSRSPLKGKSILVTGGPTPVPIDGIRILTNHFTGKLGGLIAEELTLRGSDAFLINGAGTYNPPLWLNFKNIKSYEEYKEFVLKVLEEGSFTAGIFSASVADYAPKKMGNGKIKSGQSSLRIDLSPTEKVIEKVSALYKELYMVTFKYEENLTHDELMEKARARLNEYPIIMANRKEDFEKEGEQVIWSVTKEEEAQKIVGKKNIAVKIADLLEKKLA